MVYWGISKLKLDVFNEMKENIGGVVNDNYDDLLGFLQRFYAVNVVRELVNNQSDSDIKKEGETFFKNYLDNLYDSDVCKRYITNMFYSTDKKGVRAVTTLALMETFFPEFLDGSFKVGSITDDQKQATELLMGSSELYQDTSSDFKRSLKNVLDKAKQRTNYQKVKISSDLKELLYEDYLGKLSDTLCK